MSEDIFFLRGFVEYFILMRTGLNVHKILQFMDDQTQFMKDMTWEQFVSSLLNHF